MRWPRPSVNQTCASFRGPLQEGKLTELRQYISALEAEHSDVRAALLRAEADNEALRSKVPWLADLMRVLGWHVASGGFSTLIQIRATQQC